MYRKLFKNKKIFLLFLLLDIFFVKIIFSQEYTPNEIIIKLKSLSSENLKKISSQLDLFDNYMGIVSVDNLNKKYNAVKIKSLIPYNRSVSLKKNNFSELVDGIYLIRFENSINVNDILREYTSIPEVEYTQLNYLYHLHQSKNNADSNEQWGLERINVYEAWEIEKGSRDVLVGIIDTGIDYLHKDLKENIWINPGEDLNKNGIADSSDLNGIDDDGNGFIDDIQGWDFTDVPSYPDDGDYLEPDNNPMDEMGHGTSIAGIVAALGSDGISGVAPGCRIMNLRAGTSKGFLQDDDIASAVIYAVQNGARIINMSFGDLIYSRVLGDVIRFAYNNGCVVVTSSGNNGDDRLTYPSTFDETISVGAVNEDDSLAQFSSFGNTVDVTAPGTSIYSTKIGNSYGFISGTSVSASFVSGLAALLISHNGNLFPEQVRSIILLSADDLGQGGCDFRFGAGRVNALKALNVNKFSVAKLHTPNIYPQEKRIDITGTAAGLDMKHYSFYYGIGKNPENWELIQREIKSQVVEDTLGYWNIESLPDDTYCLRLVVENYSNSSVEDRVIVKIVRSYPEVKNFLYSDIIDKDKISPFIRFETEQPTRCRIFYRKKDSDENFRIKESEYAVKFHKMVIPGEEIDKTIEFYVEVENEQGLKTKYDNNGDYFIYENKDYPFSSWEMVKEGYYLPSSFLLPVTTDFNNDNKKEIVANVYENKFSFGTLGIFEYENGSFTPIVTTDFRIIPRDAGDFDMDGKGEILGGMGAKSVIIEAEEENLFPSGIVWESEEGLWASKFCDIDNDGKKEMIARIENEFVLLENTGDNNYSVRFTFPNPTGGTNGAGIPRCEIGDFDGDGKSEILFGDSDGDIYIYEYNGTGSFDYIWSYGLDQIDAVDFISAGDFDGNGMEEFIAGCHSEDYPSESSDPKMRYWSYAIFKSKGDNDFYKVWEKNILGYNPLSIFDSGCFSGDIDNDENKEIVISAYPDLYIVDYNGNDYQIVWHYEKSRCSRFIIDDIDGNGVNELFFNDGEKIVSFENNIVSERPLPPFNLTVVPVDTDRIYLSWKSSSSADYFNIYRGFNEDELFKVTSVNENYYYDENLKRDSIYWYSVSAVNSMFKQKESLKSAVVSAKPNEKPFIKNLDFIPKDKIKITFSEPMSKEVIDETKYKISPGNFSVSSAAYSKSGREVILTLVPEFSGSGYYKIAVSKELKDIDFTPIDTSSTLLDFYVSIEPGSPYITNIEAGSNNSIILKFNIPMDKITILMKENYLFEPELKIKEIIFDEKNPDEIILKIDPKYPVGALGKSYLITVNNLKSSEGKEIVDGKGNTISLLLSKSDLSEVFSYPNPYNSLSGNGYITFANLTEKAEIWITNMSGRLIKILEENDGDGGVNWYLDNQNGEKVPSGVYLYYVEGNGTTFKGKLAIIR